MLLRFAQVVAFADKDTEQGTVAERIRCKVRIDTADIVADTERIAAGIVVAAQHRLLRDWYIVVVMKQTHSLFVRQIVLTE